MSELVISQGERVVFIGQRVPVLPPQWQVIRVHCGGPAAPLRPLHEATHRIDRLLGEPTVLDRTASRVRQGLRSRLLGEPEDTGLGSIVSSLNRLAGRERPGALIFDRIELADLGTLSVLQQILSRPGWLRPALLLSVQEAPQSGPAAALIAAIARRVAAPTAETPAPLDVRAMPPEARRVLRAAAMVGAGFDIALVADLLRLRPLDVLEHLQTAQDAGAGLEDVGDGRFQIPDEHRRALVDGLLPSLSQAWNRRLAALIAPEEPASPAAPVQPPLGETLDVEPLTEADAPPASLRQVDDPDIVDVEPLEEEGEPPLQPPPATARAAAHLGAAGEVVEAIEHYLQATAEIEPMAVMQAVAYGQEALALLSAAAPFPQRDQLRVRVLAELGRLKLEGCTPGGCFTLDEALGDLEQALAACTAQTPPILVGQIHASIAMACYERGDAPSLERALAALTTASRLLSAAGEPMEAARLLNEQAAVWIRIGDPVRAAGLLHQSRKLFSSSDDPSSAIELAQTNHLLARLPLHVPAQPGKREEALREALVHAWDAARSYGKMGRVRERARVAETIGRLELLRGKTDRAAESLGLALDTQQRIGDTLGMARTASAMAELLKRGGQIDEALSLLLTSIQLNFARGTPGGLAFNRQALQVLMDGLSPEQQSSPAALQVARTLAQAEAVLSGKA